MPELNSASAPQIPSFNPFQRYGYGFALENWVEEREEHHRDRRITAEKFLGLLDREVDGFTFQTFDDTGQKRKTLARVFNGSLAHYWNALWELNAQGAGIYVTINRTDGKGRSAKNIKGVRALFVDLDGAPLDPVMQYKLPPHFVIESSPGKFHCYWRVDDVALDQFKPLQKALAARFGGDNVCDLPRVLRLPGMFHCKGEPFLSRIVSTHDATAYKVADFDLPKANGDGRSKAKANGDGRNFWQEFGVQEVRAALAAIPNPPELRRNRWIEIGMAVHAATKGSEAGFAAFDEWSQRWEGVSEKGVGYDEKATRDAWDSLTPHEITEATLFHYAYEGDPDWRESFDDGESESGQSEFEQSESGQSESGQSESRQEQPRGPATEIPGFRSDWCDVSRLPRRRWLYGQHYIRGFATATIADGGTGKSTLSIAEGIIIASAIPALGVEVTEPCKVWYWNGESREPR